MAVSCLDCNRLIDGRCNTFSIVDGVPPTIYKFRNGYCQFLYHPPKLTDTERKQKKRVGQQKGGSGFWWRSKKEHKARKGSRTSGRTKGKFCVCSPLGKFLAKKSRSYKNKNYEAWDIKTKEANKFSG